MILNKFHSGCPVAKRTTEILSEWATIGGESKRVEFQREIVWLHQSESILEFIHGGKILLVDSTFNDFYGFLASSDPEDAVNLAAKFGINASSSLELVLRTKVFLLAAIETDECKKNNLKKPENYKSMWAYVPIQWHQERVESGETSFHSLDRVERGDEITWSSKKSDAENLEIRNAFLEKWRREVARDAVIDAIVEHASAHSPC